MRIEELDIANLVILEESKISCSCCCVTQCHLLRHSTLKQYRLHIYDKNSYLKFLVDSDSDISCIAVAIFHSEYKLKIPVSYVMPLTTPIFLCMTIIRSKYRNSKKF